MADKKSKRVELSDDMLEDVNGGIDMTGFVNSYVDHVKDHAKEVFMGASPLDVSLAVDLAKAIAPNSVDPIIDAGSDKILKMKA